MTYHVLSKARCICDAESSGIPEAGAFSAQKGLRHGFVSAVSFNASLSNHSKLLKSKLVCISVCGAGSRGDVAV